MWQINIIAYSKLKSNHAIYLTTTDFYMIFTALWCE